MSGLNGLQLNQWPAPLTPGIPGRPQQAIYPRRVASQGAASSGDLLPTDMPLGGPTSAQQSPAAHQPHLPAEPLTMPWRSRGSHELRSKGSSTEIPGLGMAGVNLPLTIFRQCAMRAGLPRAGMTLSSQLHALLCLGQHAYSKPSCKKLAPIQTKFVVAAAESAPLGDPGRSGKTCDGRSGRLCFKIPGERPRFRGCIEFRVL